MEVFRSPVKGEGSGFLVRKRRRFNGAFWGVWAAIAVAIGGYVLIASLVQAATSPFSVSELWLPRGLDCLVFAWMFWIGSAIGSFLNVVAWRMPRGQSINGFSHCPWCNHALAAQDNWPVFGWLALRGRCRTCRLPISKRYPIVELVVGVCLAVVGFAEIYLGQWNLPYISRASYGSGPMAMPTLSWSATALCIYHIIAMTGVFAFGLIRFDEQRIPRNLIVFFFTAAILPMLLWEPVMLVPWQATVPTNWPTWTPLDAVVRVLTGLVAATLVARILVRYLCPTADPKLDPMGRGTARLIDLIVMLSVPAIVVGWQALIGLVFVAVIIAWTLRSRFATDASGLSWFAVAIPIAFSLQLLFWRLLENAYYWPSSQSPPWVILFTLLLLLIVPRVLRTPAQPIISTNDTDPLLETHPAESD